MSTTSRTVSLVVLAALAVGVGTKIRDRVPPIEAEGTGTSVSTATRANEANGQTRAQSGSGRRESGAVASGAGSTTPIATPSADHADELQSGSAVTVAATGDGAFRITATEASVTTPFALRFRGVSRVASGDGTPLRTSNAPFVAVPDDDTTLADATHPDGTREYWRTQDSTQIEHGFVVHDRPRGRGDVEIRVESTGIECAIRDGEPGTIELAANSKYALVYASPRVFDATGRELPSMLRLVDATTIAIAWDDTSAAYPVHVDPTLGLAPNWYVEGNTIDVELGTSVAGGGDFNGDGIPDVLVGAPGFANGSTDLAGRIEVYFGQLGGPSLTPSWSFLGTFSGARIGTTLAFSDVNGDSIADVVTVARDIADARVLVFFGSTGTLPTTPSQSFTIPSYAAAVPVGDVNRDGMGDVVLGTAVHHGSSAGLETASSRTLASSIVGRCGDLNNDGFDDIIVGEPDFANGNVAEGRVSFHLGSGVGLAAASNPIEGEADNVRLGRLVSYAGTSGILYDRCAAVRGSQEIAIYGWAGASIARVATSGGSVSATPAITGLFHAGDTSVAYALADVAGEPSVVRINNWTTAAMTDAVNQPGNRLGASVAALGDIDRDGWEDVAVGAPRFDWGQSNEGRAYLFYGMPAPIPVDLNNLRVSGNRNALPPPTSILRFAGDVDADGFGDLLIYEGGGELEIAPGSATYGLRPTTYTKNSLLSANASALINGNPIPAYSNGDFVQLSGAALAFSADADVDGDGDADIVVLLDGGASADVILGGQRPWTLQSLSFSAPVTSLTARCDVNGDGYADVVAATATPNLEVHAGSAQGFEPPATPTVLAILAQTVMCVGDVDADGYGDVAVVNVSDRSVSVHRGGRDGLAATSAWTSAGSAGSPCIAAAGDLDGDGFADATIDGRIHLGGPNGVLTLVASAPNVGCGASPANVNGDVPGDLLYRSGNNWTVLYGSQSGDFRIQIAPLDVFAGSTTGTVMIGVFPWPVSIAAVTTAFATGDFTGDGTPELAILGQATVTVSNPFGSNVTYPPKGLLAAYRFLPPLGLTSVTRTSTPGTRLHSLNALSQLPSTTPSVSSDLHVSQLATVPSGYESRLVLQIAAGMNGFDLASELVSAWGTDMLDVGSVPGGTVFHMRTRTEYRATGTTGRVRAGSWYYHGDPGDSRGIAFRTVARVTGVACDAAGECGSGTCVDAVCCDTACGGSPGQLGGDPGDCLACSIASGGSADGVCGFVSAGRTCRAQDDLCDVAETCDGASPACPADEVVIFLPDASNPSNDFRTQCRARGAGLECDAPEYCDGVSHACPADELSTAGSICRVAAGPCDVAEVCNGVSPNCPGQVVLPQGIICHPSAGSSFCDPPETCDGTSTACPANFSLPNGEPCDDGLTCTATTACQSGICAASLTLDCSDGNPCTMDSCNEPDGCMHTPMIICGGDAGSDADANINGDGGGVVSPPSVGGCSCDIDSSPAEPLSARAALLVFGVLLALASQMRRRVRVVDPPRPLRTRVHQTPPTP